MDSLMVAVVHHGGIQRIHLGRTVAETMHDINATCTSRSSRRRATKLGGRFAKRSTFAMRHFVSGFVEFPPIAIVSRRTSENTYSTPLVNRLSLGGNRTLLLSRGSRLIVS
jgi:hypothetical protein